VPTALSTLPATPTTPATVLTHPVVVLMATCPPAAVQSLGEVLGGGYEVVGNGANAPLGAG
jgi:hypothetical protein